MEDVWRLNIDPKSAADPVFVAWASLHRGAIPSGASSWV